MSTQLIQQNDFTSEAFKNQMKMALPNHLTADRMARIALNEFRKNKNFGKCDKLSFLASIMKCCELGLEPGAAQEIHLIPFGLECNVIIGYRGLLKLVRQSGCVNAIYARCVYENDQVEIIQGTDEKITHIPANFVGKEQGRFIGVYAVAKFNDGSLQFEIMSASDIEKIKQKSSAYKRGSSPWHTDPEEMSKKTVLRRLCKYLPVSTKIQEAISLDEAADRGEQNMANFIIDGEVESIDNAKSEPSDRASEIVNKLSNKN
jgi:recombination protein RecT